MDRDLWRQTIKKTGAPPFPCPHCANGVLVLQKRALVRHLTVESSDLQAEHGFDPSLVDYSFSCWLKCAAPDCGEMVAVIGKGGEQPTFDDQHGVDWDEAFVPKFAWPMPPVFRIPNSCPKSVKNELRASFRAMWTDRAAAANRLRVAVECLLDEVGIGRRKKTAKNKFAKLTLHQRIELLSGNRPDAGKQLMAIKWLGNTGSHDSEVSFDDLLSAYELLETTLEDVLGARSKKAAQLAKQLTKKHGK